jgi:hypothetical protein
MSIPAMDISVTAPVGQSIRRAERMLFRPFDLGRWFTIGFCAWLAELGESGGSFSGGNFGGGNSQPGGGQSVRDALDQAKHYVLQNLHWILPLAIGLIVVACALGLLLLWLNSRGKFMFLHCVALDRAEVTWPWHEFAPEASSLFWFRLALTAIQLCVCLPLMAGALLLLVRMLYHNSADPAGILLIVGLGLAGVALVIGFLLVHKFTLDFVVPIMFLRRVKCSDAWREFLELLRANPGHFTVYVLFQIVLSLAVGLLVLAVLLATCCTALCLMMLPYIGTVALLPVLIFQRSYSLYYLAQYGPAYDVFPPPPPLPPALPG